MKKMTIPQLGNRIASLTTKIGELSQVMNADQVTELALLAEGTIDGVHFSNLQFLTDSGALFRTFLNDYIPNLIAERTGFEQELEARMSAIA